MPNADRWGPTGRDQLRGIPGSSVGERLISEDRLVVPPPPPEARVVPPQRRKLYIRREDVHKHGATEGCPGCTCVLENRRTLIDPHAEACGARIIEAMEKDEIGAESIQAHAKKRKEDQGRNGPKPTVVSTREREMSVEDGEGRPVAPSGVEYPAPEIPEDPNERAKLKREVMPGSPTSEAKAKPKVSPQQVMRRGGLSIASGPPLTKANPSPTQEGVKRTAEEGTGDLESIEPLLSKRRFQPQHQQRRVHQTQEH